MNGGIVYRLTFANTKVYIGITTQKLSRRIAAHRNSAKSENPKLAVHRAWKKWGEPHAEILSEHPTASELLTAETLAIAQHNSFGPGGYNSTWGGETSPAKVPEVRVKLKRAANDPERIERSRARHLGSKRTPEQRARISAALSIAMKGKKFTEEHKAKLSAINIGHKRNLGRKNSPETLKRMSEAALKRWETGCPETMRKNMSDAAIKRWAKK